MSCLKNEVNSQNNEKKESSKTENEKETIKKLKEEMKKLLERPVQEIPPESFVIKRYVQGVGRYADYSFYRLLRQKGILVEYAVRYGYNERGYPYVLVEVLDVKIAKLPLDKLIDKYLRKRHVKVELPELEEIEMKEEVKEMEKVIAEADMEMVKDELKELLKKK